MNCLCIIGYSCSWRLADSGYKLQSDLNQSDALARVKEELADSNHINDILHFYASSKRGII